MRLERGMFILIIISSVLMGFSSEDEALSRQKRYLLEPDGTQTGFFATIAIPLETMKQASVAYFFEGNYYTLANASWLRGDFEGPEIQSRSERSTSTIYDSLTRRYTYVVIENNIERLNLPGRACLLRAICEHAESPFYHNGVIGDILYIILTPSTSQDENLSSCFYEAENDGKRGNCKKYRKSCRSSVINSISHLADVP